MFEKLKSRLGEYGGMIVVAAIVAVGAALLLSVIPFTRNLIWSGESPIQYEKIKDKISGGGLRAA